jgi:hypothetical protein
VFIDHRRDDGLPNNFLSHPQHRVESCHDRNGNQSLHPTRLDDDSRCRYPHHRCRHGIVITIPVNDENRSRSLWNRCSCSPGMEVHDALETAFTFDRNMHFLARD